MPTSNTLRTTILAVVLGLALLAGLMAFPYLWPESETWAATASQALGTYERIAVWLLGVVGVGAGVYGARHLPLQGRAKTSAELAAGEGE